MEKMKRLMPDHQQRQTLLESTWNEIQAFYDNLPQRSVTPTMSLDDIHSTLESINLESPKDAKTAISTVCRLLSEGNLQCVHPRYFGLFNTTPTIGGIIGDLMASAWNPQVGAHHHAPACVEMEAYLLSYLGGMFGLPAEETAGCFTNGGSEANHMGLLMALTRAFPAYREDGARALPGNPLFYVSAEAHHSFVKMAHACGLGRNAVRFIAVDDDLQINFESLRRQISEDRAAGSLPFMLVATAGHTSSGAFDDIQRCADICTDENLYLHVDAAWGGAAAFSDELRPLLNGIERADSLTFDLHKWSMPFATGAFICKDLPGMRRTFGVNTQYVPAGEKHLNFYYMESLQWSRRAIGLRLFMTLALQGRKAYAAAIEHQTAMGRLLHRKLVDAGWTIHSASPLPLVCFGHDLLDAGRTDDDPALKQRYDAFAAGIVARGTCWMSVTVIKGRPVLRACITSYLVDEDDLDLLMKELEQSIGEYRETSGDKA